jgi:hypothetical protein
MLLSGYCFLTPSLLTTWTLLPKADPPCGKLATRTVPLALVLEVVPPSVEVLPPTEYAARPTAYTAYT